MANDNKEIGRFDLSDIPPAPRGSPQIEVSFDIDADGILHVSAKDLSSGKEQKIRIEAQSGLKEDEIQRMVKDAEIHKEEDKKRKEEIEVKNEAEALSFRAQKALNEYKDKLPQDVITDVQGKIDGVKKALEGENFSQIKTAKDELESHMQHIGEAMAKAGGAGAGAHAHAAGGMGGAGHTAGENHGEAPHRETHREESRGRSADQSGASSSGDTIEDAEVEIIEDDK